MISIQLYFNETDIDQSQYIYFDLQNEAKVHSLGYSIVTGKEREISFLVTMVTITCSVSRLHIFWRDALSFRQWKSKRYCWSSSLYFPNQRNTYQRYIILRGKMEIMRLYHILKYIQIYIRKAFNVGYKLQVPYLQLCWNTSWTESVLVLFLN